MIVAIIIITVVVLVAHIIEATIIKRQIKDEIYYREMLERYLKKTRKTHDR